MDYCSLHRIGYSNSDDECPLCTGDADGAARGVA